MGKSKGDRYHEMCTCFEIGLTRGPYSVDIGQEDSLLKPDDTLASIESLVNLANMSCLSQPESTVTTLVFPNATQLDESVAAALPNNPKTLYRVKKLSSAIGHIPTKKSKVWQFFKTGFSIGLNVFMLSSSVKS